MLEIIHQVKNVMRSLGNIRPTAFDPVEACAKANPILVELNINKLIKQTKGRQYIMVNSGLRYGLGLKGIPGSIQSNKELVMISSIEEQRGKMNRGMVGMSLPLVFIPPRIDFLEMKAPVFADIPSPSINGIPSITPPRTPPKTLERYTPPSMRGRGGESGRGRARGGESGGGRGGRGGKNQPPQKSLSRQEEVIEEVKPKEVTFPPQLLPRGFIHTRVDTSL